jgi:hypothetical protein
MACGRPSTHRQWMRILLGALLAAMALLSSEGGPAAAAEPAKAGDETSKAQPEPVRPYDAGNVPIQRVVDEIRCNLGKAVAAAKKAKMQLTISHVELHVNAGGSRGNGTGVAVEIPAVVDQIGIDALGKAGPSDLEHEPTHTVEIGFVPFAEDNASEPACEADLGLLSVVQSAIAVLGSDKAGTDRLNLRFSADFVISMSKDAKIGFVFVPRDAELKGVAVQGLTIDLQLDRGLP